MVWGVSGVDVRVFAQNTAVGCGVAVGCGIAAYAVSKLGEIAFAPAKTASTAEQESAFKKMDYASYAGVVVGLAAAGAAYYFAPASRFALITDDSTSKMFKVGFVEVVTGLVADTFLSNQFSTATVVGLGGALATRFGNVVLLGFGALGTAFGAGYIAR